MHSARRVLVVGAGWLAAALLATLVALAGIRLVGESLTGTPGGVRSERDVARALAAGPPPAVAAPSSAPPPGDTRGPAGTPLPGNPGTPPSGSQPPGTQPPSTQPPSTQPPSTQPPRTQPPSTQAPGTQAAGTPAVGTPAAATPAPVSFTTAGGSALARCAQDQAYLVSWSPRPGYRVVQHEQGPDDEVKVRFEGGGRTYRLEIVCRGGVPVVRDE